MRLLPVAFLLLSACDSRSAVPHGEREESIVEEVNALRADPAGYAAHLEKRLRYFRGNTLHLPGRTPLRTTEGPAAVREAVETLLRTEPVPTLKPAPGLAMAARDHVEDIGPKGTLSHEGSDGTSQTERLKRYARFFDLSGESISFGPEDPRQVVIELLTDDNIPSRGHRKILLDPRFRHIGVACGHHAKFRTVCVLNFAGRWIEKS